MLKPQASQPDGGQTRVTTRLATVAGVLRRHWIASLLIGLGIVLRVLTQVAYYPAIIYIDTLKYLYPAWPGSDPIEYKIPLKFILAFRGGLPSVELVQHLLGIAMAVTIYAVLLRRGAPRWLGALAIAPVLLDAYQLQVEAMIMPDIWFEAMVVAGAAVLLWKPQLSVPRAVVGAALLGASVGMRQVGEILILPALVYVLAVGGGWRVIAKNAVAVGGAFVAAVLLYMGASLAIGGHFWLSRSSVSLTYGRMATVADCATLHVPAIEQSLCPTKAWQKLGPDHVEHDLAGPYRQFLLKVATLPPADQPANKWVSSFNRAVETHQPLRVIGGIARDAVKLFALTRVTSQGDTPLWRWQFQGNYPSYCPYIIVGTCPNGPNAAGPGIWLSYPHKVAGVTSFTPVLLKPGYGGYPHVNKPIASFLRGYMLGGGYTPGPLYLVLVLVGLAGSAAIFARRRLSPEGHQLVLGCLLFFATGVAVLVASDFFEFSWRYQLPALVTLPPAAALGVAVLIDLARGTRTTSPASTVSGRAPELTAPAP
jgi:hypothetical protein